MGLDLYRYRHVVSGVESETGRGYDERRLGGEGSSRRGGQAEELYSAGTPLSGRAAGMAG